MGVPHLDLGDEVVGVLLRGAAVRLVDVLRHHAGVYARASVVSEAQKIEGIASRGRG